MTVQQLIEQLSKVEDKQTPVTVWIDGERYYTSYVDDSIEGVVEINAE
jgi:hypothetical protein